MVTPGPASTVIAPFPHPMKLFTANETLMVKRVAFLKEGTYKVILTVITASLQKNMPK